MELKPLVKRLDRFAHGHRRLVASLVYGGITTAGFALAFVLRFEFTWPGDYTRVFLATLPALLLIRLAVSYQFRLGVGRWRFVGTQDVMRLFWAVTVGTGLFFVFTRFLPLDPAVPRSVILIEWVLTGYMTAGVWLLYRLAFEHFRHRSSSNGADRRVIMVGAGEAAQMLVHEMQRYPTGYRPVGFVDDDPFKWGSSIHGVEVIGSTGDLGKIAGTVKADELIIAIPSASPDDLRRIVEACERTNLSFKMLPGISEVLAGDAHVSQLRDVRLEDLLGRDPIELELPELAEDLRGHVVLITGAAGSIGSELSRQVALHRPDRLVLLDQAETPLFYIHQELREQFPGVDLQPVVGDVLDPVLVEDVFATHGPGRVFHAAAYKHVPLMEMNLREAVRNNVLGTWRVAEAAGRAGTERFVLVSTDKAVNPVNVMGASKRLAEMVVLDLQAAFPGTSFGAVRFGNVLGSNGSVIPIFRRQLRAGRPLTVTDEEVTRYFMTIPEAVQLILQASLLPDFRGHIAMLEMGEPVRIVDLARNLLRLSGMPYRPGKNVVFTGLRPGEKLHEELVASEEDTVPTAVEKVRLIVSRNGLHGDLRRWVELLEGGSDDDALSRLADFFPNLQCQTRPGELASAASEEVEAVRS